MADKENAIPWSTNGVAEGVVPALPPTGAQQQQQAPQVPVVQMQPQPTPPGIPTLPQQPQEPQLSLAEVLSQETGVPLIPSFQSLDPANPFGAPTSPQQQQPGVPPQQQQQQVPQLTNVPGYNEFNTQFKQMTGLELQDAVANMSQVQTLLPQLQQMYDQFQQFSTKGVPSLVQGLREEVNLRYEWGQDFDRNMTAVQQAYQQLPPQLQQALNNLQGARLIYSHIAQQQQQQSQPRQGAPRSLQGVNNAGPTNNQQQQQQTVPMSQLMKLSREQFNSPEVGRLIDSGLVDLNT